MTHFKSMNFISYSLALLAVAVIGFSNPVYAQDKNEKKHTRVVAMKDATLKRLVTEHPEAEEQLKNSVGYGVFSNTGASIFILHGSSGRGVIIDNKSGKRTFMKIKKVGVGLGIGIKDYRSVLIFNTEDAMQKFLDEGEFAQGEFDAAAASDTKGGATGGVHEVDDDVITYQMTKNGLIIGVHVTGAKYKLDKKLNAVEDKITASGG